MAAGSFLTEIKIQLDPFLSDLENTLGDSISLGKEFNISNLDKGTTIPDTLTIMGHVEPQTAFLTNLMGTVVNAELIVDTEDIAYAYASYGITKMGSAPKKKDVDQIRKDVDNIVGEAEIRFTIRIHGMNYVFLGTPSKKINYEGWER